MGSEALLLLRAEKGYLIVGKDTDGTTIPDDLGLSGPRDKRRDEFVGKRSLFTDDAMRGRSSAIRRLERSKAASRCRPARMASSATARPGARSAS